MFNEIWILKRIDKNKATQVGRHKYLNVLILFNNMIKYLSREEEFLKILNHENIVKYITSFEDNQFLYLFTEYVDNGDLLMIINKKGNAIFK